MAKSQTDIPQKSIEQMLHDANMLALENNKPLQPRVEEVIDQQTLAAIEGYSLDELKTLVRRLLCQCGAYAMMTQEETAQAMLDTLAEIALRPIAGANLKADIQSRMNAIDKWLDRTRGKAHQAVDMTLKAAIVHWPLGRTKLDECPINLERIS